MEFNPCFVYLELTTEIPGPTLADKIGVAVDCNTISNESNVWIISRKKHIKSNSGFGLE